MDLFYRISSFIVKIMPLRDRPEDIPELIEYFKKRSPEFRHKQFSKEALAVLSRYPWPGNVRELQNVLHRVLLLSANDVVELADLPLDLCGAQQSGSVRLEDMEREHILRSQSIRRPAEPGCRALA
jgi:DNA-binding NtrC family response regulator